MGWAIGPHRVEQRRDPTLLVLAVDDERKTIADARQLGAWPLRIGAIDVEVRRVRNLDIARTELWIGDQRIPSSHEGSAQRRARKGEVCEVHPVSPASYRTNDGEHPAALRCPGCRKHVCDACVTVDQVRCRACFDAAGRDDERALARSRKLGPLAGFGIGVGFLVLGLAARSPRLVQLGAGCVIFLALIMARSLWYERSARRSQR